MFVRFASPRSRCARQPLSNLEKGPTGNVTVVGIAQPSWMAARCKVEAGLKRDRKINNEPLCYTTSVAAYPYYLWHLYAYIYHDSCPAGRSRLILARHARRCANPGKYAPCYGP